MNWFEEAIEFDIHLGSYNEKVKEVTNHLFNEITKRIIIRNKPRSKETLKLTLLNLWVALQQGVPVYYSRNANDYSRSRRYGMLHVKYNRLIPIIDTLEAMGLIRQKKGLNYRNNGIRRQTRMYATKSLIGLFTDITPNEEDVVQKIPPRETVQLKDGSKKLIDYRETEHTVAMRRNLFHYNNFVRKQDISLDLPGDCLVNRRFLKELYHNFLKGVVVIDNVELIHPGILKLISNNHVYPSNLNLLTYQSLPYYSLPYHIFYLMYDTHTTHYHTLLYYLSTMTNKIREMENRNVVKAFLSDTRTLAEFGINSLTCWMNYEVLHRVFNNGSFDLGGRFFGAYHVGLGKEFRRHIMMNGKPTMELDYSALHIRMLYHMEGIDYREDPYSVLCDRDEDRKMYKLLQLITINAANEKQAIMAVRDVFRKQNIGYDLTDAAIGKLLDKFRLAHHPIQKYLNTGIGVMLQNFDSMITERIISSLIKDGISCLPVHDSYIVEATDQDILKEKMTDEYAKLMKYEPSIL